MGPTVASEIDIVNLALSRLGDDATVAKPLPARGLRAGRARGALLPGGA